MGVLDHQLGLADLAQPVHRLHRHRRPHAQPGVDGVQFAGPAGEMRITPRNGEHLRQRAPGNRGSVGTARSGNGGVDPGLARPRTAAAISSRNRRRAAASDRSTRSIPTTPVSNPAARSPPDPHRDQLALLPVGVRRPRRLPLRRGVHRGHIVRRQPQSAPRAPHPGPCG